MRRWPWIPALTGLFLFFAGAAPAAPAPPAEGDASPPALSGVLQGDAAIDPASVVLTVDGRTLYTGDFDWHLHPGSVFEIEWLAEDHTVAHWFYRTGPEEPEYAPAEQEVGVEFRDRNGRRYAVSVPLEEDGVFLASAQPVLTIANALAYPNPFNPFTDDVTLEFDLNMDAQVKITAYDWAGEFVGMVFEGAGTTGQNQVLWGGQAEGGRKLGNGVYLVRVTASTQARTESAVLKVVVWNEE